MVNVPNASHSRRHNLFLAPTLTLAALSVLVAACSDPDQRLVSDEHTCVTMEHVQDSPSYGRCLADLNARRCNENGKRGHQASRSCTKL